ncbi:MAG: ATP-binding domain-containing protein [Clostridiales bacterium]|jgi:DNA helicase-2/ATP-dependent DNA helicase PcrA|nr:ATP-binding domain-containing protein [Clostridiales bacterium]
MSTQQKSETIPFPDEIEYLATINQKLEDAMREADLSVGRTDKEYMDTKHYMVKNRGEIDPHEMFTTELELKRIDDRGAFAVRMRDKIAKLKDSPYFARIDFQAEDESSPEAYYIGLFSFDYDGELLISDWRAPIASMFYDHEVGAANYIAPAGQIKGELTRKRQFKIKNGCMAYALESAVSIQDDVLQRELSSTSDEKMKSIISTIQKEQNQIIRNENSGTLIIQGVAGSGKPSIALHRVAYLLYRFKEKLTANNVTILSPNKVFGDYIANVLPELGEEPIYEISFQDIAEVQLQGVIGFEADKDPLTTADTAWAERVRYKSTLGFVKTMDAFIERMSDFIFEPTDYGSERFTATAEMIGERFRTYKKYPVKRRLQMIADDLHDRFTVYNFMEDTVPRKSTILSALSKMLKYKDTLSIYKEFYQQNNLTELFVQPKKKTLEWNDVYPFLYLHAAFAGLKESGVIKHLVVDEMQDYTPMQYAVLNRLFACQKTILGDFGQLVNPNHQHTLEDLRQVFDGAEFTALTKSYRSTFEIISFAKQIKAGSVIDAIERHGEKPAIIRCTNKMDEIKQIRKRIRTFAESEFAAMGIITKTDDDAKILYELLADDQIHLLSPDSDGFSNGVTITSIRMSKGLEFDEVLIADADSKNYCSEYDRSLLYIACTRAMHRLTLLYTGVVTQLCVAAHTEL